MSPRLEKVKASEIARRYEVPESAVVHRIRAGIYDGLEENGAWYVLLNSSSDVERASPGLGYTPAPSRPLPWRTTLFPLRWTAYIRWTAFIVFFLPMLLDPIERWLVFSGAGGTALTSVLLYEGLRTGTIRTQHFGPATYELMPGTFVSHVLIYAFFGVMCLTITILELTG